METVITIKVTDLKALDRLTGVLAQTLTMPKVIGLVGNLGAGKTTFVQSLARAFEILDHVASPSFGLEHRYSSRAGIRIIHVDLYRVQSLSELMDIGLRDEIDSENTLVVVEWADKFPQYFNNSTVWIEFYHTDSGRTVRIRGLSHAEVLKFEAKETL